MAATAPEVQALSTVEPSRLERSERELADAMAAHFEAFYRQGVILKRILRDREFADSNFTSFDEYVKKRQPLGLKPRHAWRLITAVEVRDQMPDLDCPNGQSATWTESCLRPLTHKSFSTADHQRLGKKIAVEVKNGERLTANLVKSICDADRGVANSKTKKHVESLKTASLTSQLKKLADDLADWRASLEELASLSWQDVDRTILQRVNAESKMLVAISDAELNKEAE